MLKYLIAGTESLVSAGVLLGMLYAYVLKGHGRRGRAVMTASFVLGFLAAAVMSYMKNKTKLIDTGAWNLRIFPTWIAALILFLAADLKVLKKKNFIQL